MVSWSAETDMSKFWSFLLFLSKDTTAAQVTVLAGAQDIQMDHSVIIAGQVVSEHFYWHFHANPHLYPAGPLQQYWGTSRKI